MSNVFFYAAARLGLHLLIPMGLLLVPTQLLDEGHSICFLKNIAGVECPGCGMTRAISSILHLDFSRALHYNRLVIIVFPLLCLSWLKSVFSAYRQIREIGSHDRKCMD